MRKINHSSRFIEMFGGIQNGRKWPLKKLSEICHLVNGYAFKSALYSNEGFSIIRIANVQKGYIDNSDRAYYPVSFEKEFKDSILQKGDILISLTGNVGRVGVITDKHLPAALNQRVQGLRLRKGIPMSNDFLFCVLNLDEFESLCIENASGSAQLNLSTIWVRDFQIICPPFDKQREFTQFANQADKSKFSDFKSRFIEMFGTLDSPKVPVKRMIEVSKASGQYGLNASAVNYIEGRPRYIRITDICDDGSLNDDIKCSDIDDSTYSVNKGDVLFARTGATVGKTYLHRSGDACFAGYLIRYSFTEAVDPEYILAYTHSDTYYDWVLKSQKVGAQPNISASQYDNMPILIPGRKEQEAFLCLYRQADKSKYLN